MIEGPIFTSSGYGEHCRLVYRALRKNKNLDIFLHPVNWGQTSWTLEASPEREELEELVKKSTLALRSVPKESWKEIFDIYVHVGIPSEFSKNGKFSVSVTAGIETNKVSSQWILKTHTDIDKMIVPSEHSKSGFVNSFYDVKDQSGNEASINAGCPISVVPYPVKTYENIDPIIDLDTDFNFLSIALWGSRKNNENLIKWFVEEFKDENVGLVLKTGFARTSKPDRVNMEKHLTGLLNSLEIPDRKCKIYFLHGALTDQEIHSLYTHPKIKAYATATHGEGFGLAIFEAAYSGVPVIATDWSGHLDFMIGPLKENNKIKLKKLFAKVDFDLKKLSERELWDHILIKDSMWAIPKERSFKTQLRNIYKNYGMYKKWAISLKDELLDSHSEEEILKLMEKEILEDSSVELNFEESEGDGVIVL